MGTNYYLYDEQKKAPGDQYWHICKNHSYGVTFYISKHMQMTYLRGLEQDKLLIIDEYGTLFTPQYLIDLVDNRKYTEDDYEFF